MVDTIDLGSIAQSVQVQLLPGAPIANLPRFSLVWRRGFSCPIQLTYDRAVKQTKGGIVMNEKNYQMIAFTEDRYR